MNLSTKLTSQLIDQQKVKLLSLIDINTTTNEHMTFYSPWSLEAE